MCEFCQEHGEGRKWYLNAKNYAEDLLSDARRRRFWDQYNNAPQEKLFLFFENFDSQMDRLNHLPGIVRRLLSWRAINRQKCCVGQLRRLAQPSGYFEAIRRLSMLLQDLSAGAPTLAYNWHRNRLEFPAAAADGAKLTLHSRQTWQLVFGTRSRAGNP